ncbi:25115_t:CDS:2, partial [Cetraspora pellucida]
EKQNQEAKLPNKTRSLEKSILDTSANANKTVGFNKNYVETCQKLPKQLKQTEHVLQNSYIEYDNNKTQGISHVTKETGSQPRPKQWSELFFK